MGEEQIFGVQDPETGELSFISVMGLLGEHLSIGVYLGVDALQQFWNLHDLAANAESWEISSRLFTIPQIQASFENRETLEREDIGIMRKLDLTYNGRLAYPMFRNIQPGCPPYFLDVDRIPFLIHVLEQLIDVATRYKEDNALLHPDDVGDDETYLLRVPTIVDGKIIWTDEIKPIPLPNPESHQVLVTVDAADHQKLLDIPRAGNTVEIDLFMLDRAVARRGKQPYFPFTLLIVESDSGVVLSHEVLSPLPSLDDMYSKVPRKVIEFLLENNLLPYEIHTQTYAITSVLSAIFKNSEIPIVQLESLPMLNEAKIAMMQHLR